VELLDAFEYTRQMRRKMQPKLFMPVMLGEGIVFNKGSCKINEDYVFLNVYNNDEKMDKVWVTLHLRKGVVFPCSDSAELYL